MSVLLLAAALGRFTEWARRWEGVCLLGMGVLSITVLISIRRYVPPLEDGDSTASITALCLGLFSAVCLVLAVVARRGDTDTFPSRAQLRQVLVALSIGAGVTAVALTGFALIRAVPEQIQLADESPLVGPARLSFMVALGMAVAAAIIIWVTRSSGETNRLVTALLTGLGAVLLAWLILFKLPGALHEAHDLALVPGVQESSPIALVGVIVTAAGGTAAIGLVVEQFTRSTGEVRAISAPTTAVVCIVLAITLIVGSSAAAGLYLQQGRSTHTSPAAAAPARAYPTVPGMADYRISLRDNPARSVVPTGDGFAFFDRDSLVAYDGVTGQRRWHIDLALLDRTIPGRSSRQGLDNHRFLLANGSGTSSTLTMVGANDRVVTVDAITGRTLWSTTDDIYFLDTSRRATARNALVGIRTRGNRSDIVSLDPRSGTTLWARPTSSNCSPRGDIIGTVVALTDRCGLRDRVAVVDTRTGAAQPTTNVGHSGPISAEGDVFAVGPSSEVTDDATTSLIDPTSGAVVESLVGGGLRSTVRAGQYLTASPSGQLEIRTVASPRRIKVYPGFEPVTAKAPAVWIGADLTAITMSTVYGPGVVTTNPQIPGGIAEMPLPCPPRSDRSSLINVPGAMLVLCTTQDRRGAFEIVGSGDSTMN
ncbi:PQQ-binding-like beta-propeller repeat protein [Williamsia sp.]|uniref:outer membrane protein assembly factor BamB family protein n=1 Tax=Williamsia sp. TaxID=1872085 RepID=UPI001A2D65C6|nr:PQQ-binding-like beta-propeller repeat protein [Williamsia sp.]MBJ7290914.1 PQQ-binding-like beta-propeller repeat protein [Williamsia sp.]